MKKLLLVACASLGALSATRAQTLTAATNNPVAGDLFYRYICDSAHAAMGASGTSVTWDQTLLVTDSTDTVRYFSCASTPYCDSFSGSNVVQYTDSSYAYMIASSSSLQLIGAYDPSGIVHLTNPRTIMQWPLSYGASFSDVSQTVLSIAPIGDIYLKFVVTYTCDGSGTLKLPGSLTYSNVLRVHSKQVVIDSVNFLGSPMVDSSSTDEYDWYTSGFHNPLLTIGYDTAGATAPYVSGVSYYKKPGSAGVNALTATSDMQLYPNPATDAINISYNPADKPSAIIITNLVGSTVATVTEFNTAGRTSINTAALPAGIYIARMHTANGIVSQKFNVAH
jgi:hypothetical protein